MHTLKRKSGLRNREGATVVEMAMCLPIFFLLFFGCFEFARANMIRHATSAAAYEGARRGIVPGATATDVENSVRFTMATIGVRNIDVDVSPNPLTLTSRKVKVTVSLKLKDNTPWGLMFTENARLLGECELGREGF